MRKHCTEEAISLRGKSPPFYWEWGGGLGFQDSIPPPGPWTDPLNPHFSVWLKFTEWLNFRAADPFFTDPVSNPVQK